MEHLCRQARALDLPYGDRTMTYNSRHAQELGIWAQDTGKGERFHDATFKAYFVDGENLAMKEILLKIAERTGLDQQQAEKIIDTRSYSEAVDRDWQRARDLGIDAVPTFVIDTDKLVGAQEYRSLVKFVTRHGAQKV